tara:strand:+ start:515 stop:922 length:408 start_codon:yes stop_codon:yes gene_type:complete
MPGLLNMYNPVTFRSPLIEQMQQEGLLKRQRPNDMMRVDGTQKSMHGFLGPITNKKGQTMTELSIQFEDVLDGRPIPLLVPGLTPDEIDWLKNNDIEGKAYMIPHSIKQKAITSAVVRAAKGLNPFYQEQEEEIF